MRLTTHSLALILIAAVAPSEAATTATNVMAVTRHLLHDGSRETNAFDIVAAVVRPYHPQLGRLLLEDASASQSFYYSTSRQTSLPREGDLVRVKGRSCPMWDPTRPIAFIESLELLGHREPPENPRDTTAREIADNRALDRTVRIRGIVHEAFSDEIDRRFTFLIVRDATGTVYLTLQHPPEGTRSLSSLIGAEIEATGVCLLGGGNHRRQISHSVGCDWTAIRIRTPAPSDPFAVPTIETTDGLPPDRAVAVGRIKVVGHVLSVRKNGTVLVRREKGAICRVELRDKARLPQPGAAIEAVGLPDTDLYHMNLLRAVWRPTELPPQPADEIETLAADDLLIGESPRLHGHLVRLAGIVRNLSDSRAREQTLTLASGNHLVPIDVGTFRDELDGLTEGSTVEVTGIFEIAIDSWRPNVPFPGIRDFTIVPRTVADIRLIARPPWWTTGRLLTVIGALFALLVSAGVWSILLRRLADRRGRQLLEERTVGLAKSLKVVERTRLAVELHDTLAQNLMAVSLEIGAANRLGTARPDETSSHLGRAATMLDACRNELRNCLWDLRSQALEESDLNEAIRRTLDPHVGATDVKVRFCVRRELLSDNAVHALMMVIRELVLNALKHGHATKIRISGSVEDDRLLFAVTDNGSGFDPATRPDVGQGHFGLQGVRERLERFGGTLSIESRPGGGSRLSGSLRLTRKESRTA